MKNGGNGRFVKGLIAGIAVTLIISLLFYFLIGIRTSLLILTRLLEFFSFPPFYIILNCLFK